MKAADDLLSGLKPSDDCLVAMPADVYTEEDAKQAAKELSAPSSWAILLNVIGAVCLVLVALSPLAVLGSRVQLSVVLSLLGAGLGCFFCAHLTTQFKHLYIYQRELYVMQMRRELRRGKDRDCTAVPACATDPESSRDG